MAPFLFSPADLCFVAQPLSSLCCTLTLSLISRYRSVPPHHTTGQLIIHFIISSTTHTHICTPQGVEQTRRHPCRYTVPRHTQTQALDNFSIKPQTPTDYPPCTAAANREPHLSKRASSKYTRAARFHNKVGINQTHVRTPVCSEL